MIVPREGGCLGCIRRIWGWVSWAFLRLPPFFFGSLYSISCVVIRDGGGLTVVTDCSIVDGRRCLY
jgi:hypothetical protein